MFFNDLKQTRGKVYISNDWCKGCAFCVQFCPTKVLEMSDDYNAKGYHPPYVKNPDACNDCKFCQLICPEFSIYVTGEEENNIGETKK
ncbi:MAG: 4Fe-4S dicluster domain-containing protein [Nitrosomonadales bacterium]|nr:4Fe-4S dicluster domain-containing protein [Nitrosomonadales bacterium]